MDKKLSSGTQNDSFRFTTNRNGFVIIKVQETARWILEILDAKWSVAVKMRTARPAIWSLMQTWRQKRTNTLSSFVNEQIAENEDVFPDWLNGLVNVYEQTAVSVRKAAKNLKN